MLDVVFSIMTNNRLTLLAVMEFVKKHEHYLWPHFLCQLMQHSVF